MKPGFKWPAISLLVLIVAVILICFQSKPNIPVHLKVRNVEMSDCEMLQALETETSNVNWPRYVRQLEKSTKVLSLVSMGTFGYFYQSQDLRVSDMVEWTLKLGCGNLYSQKSMDSIHARRDYYVRKRENSVIKITIPEK